VFILPVLYGESERRAINAIEFLRKIESKKVTAYTSMLTWDEVTWVVLKALGKADSRQAGKKLLQFPNLRFVEVNESVISKSQSLIENYEMKPRDAIHCSSALVKGIRQVVTDDSDFEALEGLKRMPLEVAAKIAA
jgi:uncharacterized protein